MRRSRHHLEPRLYLKGYSRVKAILNQEFGCLLRLHSGCRARSRDLYGLFSTTCLADFKSANRTDSSAGSCARSLSVSLVLRDCCD